MSQHGPNGPMQHRRGKTPQIPGLANASVTTIYPHIFTNADREVGGFLIGRAPQQGALPLITGAIPALSADEQRATLTFTQDAWELVHRRLDTEYPSEDQIVGWYHSHPSFGIFLSEHDLFIHRNFFGGLSQIALVIDPINLTEGVFAWRDGDVAPLFERPTPPTWMPSSNRGPLPARRIEIEPPPGMTAALRDPRALLSTYVIAAAIGIAIGFMIWHAVLRPSPADQRRVTAPTAAHSGSRATRGSRTTTGKRGDSSRNQSGTKSG